MRRSITSHISVPSRLKLLLSQDQRLEGAITSAVDDFSVWFAENRTPFFVDYTDHGVQHISNVLASADALIVDEAWHKLTPIDAAYLIGASLLHDSAMHLSVDGLAYLLREQDPFVVSKLMQKSASWADEYHSFIQEATRWVPDKIFAVIGDYDLISDPARRMNDLHDRDRRLLGEFIRRHHARMAHEFALLGIPGPNGRVFAPFPNLGAAEQDLVGFIARSHHLGIREATDRLPKQSRSLFRSCHVPFIMAVLRIADYIQIDADRADKRLLQMRSLRSPISRLEWAKHNGIQDLHWSGSDPEALYVRAEPPSAEVFVGLRCLFLDIQRELDETWALIGEVYGRIPELRSLGIHFRRLRSNLDDVEEFIQDFDPSYVPKEVRLTTASAELLQLLVAPLYGERPSVGVRELLQNALDACSERAAVEESRDGSFVSNVSVSFVERGEHTYLEVADNGLGMTLDTVQNYYLRAGASFRRSRWWRETFLDENGSARVTRSGRFGIGALAAFLLGDHVHVRTRHLMDTSGKGFAFDLSLDGSLVEVRKEECPFGTTVRVGPLSRAAISAIIQPTDHPAFNQWYLLKDPAVQYAQEIEAHRSEELLAAPEAIDINHPKWRAVPNTDFDYIGWSYSEKIQVGKPDYSYSRSFLSCNGLFVSYVDRGGPELHISSPGSPFKAATPTLLVLDKKGLFPLNIQRTGLSAAQYPFQEALEDSLASSLSKALLAAVNLPPVPSSIPHALTSIYNVLADSCQYYWHAMQGKPLVGLNNGGWFVCEPKVLRELSLGDIAMEMVVKGSSSLALSNASEQDVTQLTLLPAPYDSFSNASFKQFLRGVLDGSAFERFGRRALSGVVYFSEDYLAGLDRKPKVPKFLMQDTTMMPRTASWARLYFGNEPQKTRLEQMDRWIVGTSARAFVVVETVDAPAEDPGRSLLGEHLLRAAPAGYWHGAKPGKGKAPKRRDR